MFTATAALKMVFVSGGCGTFRPPCDAVFISVGVESIRVYSRTWSYCKMARYTVYDVYKPGVTKGVGVGERERIHLRTATNRMERRVAIRCSAMQRS